MAHQPSSSCPFCHRRNVTVKVDGTGSQRLDGHTRKSGRRGGYCHKGSGSPVVAPTAVAA